MLAHMQSCVFVCVKIRNILFRLPPPASITQSNRNYNGVPSPGRGLKVTATLVSNRQGRLSLSGLIFSHQMAVFGFLSTSLTASVDEEVCLRVFIGFRYLLRGHV